MLSCAPAAHLRSLLFAGDYPQWDLYIQTMDPAIEDTLDFDPLDSTKIWPEVYAGNAQCCHFERHADLQRSYCMSLLSALCLPSGLRHLPLTPLNMLFGTGPVPTAPSWKDGARPQRGQLLYGMCSVQ